MRILVISDSHKKGATVDRIIRSNPDAKHIFFLGDHTGDIEDLTYEYTDRIFHIVRGNCDGFCDYPLYDIVKLEGISILYAHGHTFDVKYGINRLKEFAKNCECNIALYGHTHKSDISYRDGIYIVNPGSCASSREGADSYAVIDILKSGILPQIKKV